MDKSRLDVLLVERGLIESRERAKAVIMSGNVFIGGIRADKPGVQVAVDAEVSIREGLAYVSRGGQKLEKALKFFSISPISKASCTCSSDSFLW